MESWSSAILVDIQSVEDDFSLSQAWTLGTFRVLGFGATRELNDFPTIFQNAPNLPSHRSNNHRLNGTTSYTRVRPEILLFHFLSDHFTKMSLHVEIAG